MLGIEVDYEQGIGQMKISQGAFITRMIERFEQAVAKLVKNPNIEGQFLVKSKTADSKMERRPYRSLVGSLLYVANGTRPDIAYSVCQLSRHLDKPSGEHWNAAIRVLRYLKSTISKGICYASQLEEIEVFVCSDADWASKKENRRSTSGILVMIKSLHLSSNQNCNKVSP